MTNIIILLSLLLVALIFVALPRSYFLSSSKKKINLEEVSTSEIASIIMFVSNLQQNEDVSCLLSYKILSQMNNNNKKKKVWLIHSSISKDDNSSYVNAYNLKTQFTSNNFKIETRGIDDIFDIEESFNVVNSILSVENKRPRKDKILCDFTSGTKPMSLGMASACVGGKQLVYFPKSKDNDANNFLHVNLGEFMR